LAQRLMMCAVRVRCSGDLTIRSPVSARASALWRSSWVLWKSIRSWGSVTVESGGGGLREPTLGCARGSAIETARGAGTRSDLLPAHISQLVQCARTPRISLSCHCWWQEPKRWVHASMMQHAGIWTGCVRRPHTATRNCTRLPSASQSPSVTIIGFTHLSRKRRCLVS